MEDLLQQGITAFRAGKRDESRNIFIAVIKQNPDNEQAWGWMYQASSEDKERIYCLKQILRINPQNEKAKQMLDTFAGQNLPFEASQAELKRDANLSVNQKENLESQNPQTDRETTYRPGDVIGQEYEVRNYLGGGGFGDVYLVYSLKTEEEVALKTFHNEFLADAKIRDLFRKEANTLVQLERHPNLVRTFLVNEISGRLFIEMEYIAPNEMGINSLGGYLQNTPPKLVQSLRWAIQICYGMEYAYSKGIRTHRDIKPENIMIDQNGTAKITDFGLAGLLDSLPVNSTKLAGNIGLSGKTQIGAGFGTPTHMPPEQFIDATSCDQRSDIYAFGVVLFQMVSGGESPFWAKPPQNDWLDWLQLHNEDPVPKLNSPLFPIIQRCLEKKPDYRYQGFKQLRSDLEYLLKQQNGEEISSPKLGELDSEEWNQKGISLVNLGRNEEAIHCFEQVLKINPQKEKVWNNKGSSLASLGRYDEAIYCYEKALHINPKYAHAWSGKGICLSRMKRDADALDCFNQALKIDPQDGKTWGNKGVCLATQGHHEEAILSFDQALRLNPMDAKVWLGRGYSLAAMGRQAEALRCYDKALEINPLEVDSIYAKANSLGSLARYEEAINYYDQVLTIQPRNIDALGFKGNSLADLKRYKDAIRCYDKVLEIDPRIGEAWCNKGISLSSLERHEEAISCYDKALEIDPCDVNALYKKGICLVGLVRYEESIRYFDKILEIDSHYLGAWINKADGLYLLGQKQNAVRAYRQFIKLAQSQDEKFVEYAQQRIKEIDMNQANSQTLFQRFFRKRKIFNLNKKGYKLQSLGRYKEAIQYFDKVLEIDSSDVAALNLKGFSLLSLNRVEDAIHCADKVLEIDPRDTEALIIKGSSLSCLNRDEESIRCFDKILEIDPRNAEALISKANGLDSLGRKQEAVQFFLQFLALNPPSAQYAKFIKLAHERIQELEGDGSLEKLNAQELNDKGNNFQGLGRYEEAIRYYDKALKIDPRHVDALYHKALCEDNLGLKQEAYFSYCRFFLLVYGMDSEFVTKNGKSVLRMNNVEPVKTKKEYIEHGLKRQKELSKEVEH